MRVALILAVMEEERKLRAKTKLLRRSLQDASDPLSLTSENFISFYRLNKEAFVMVLEEIAPSLKSCSIPAIIQLASTLRFLATGAYQSVVGKDVKWIMGRNTFSTTLLRVMNAIENKICPHWIKLKMSPEEKMISRLHFYTRYQIPGIVGCIDGTHIEMSKPTEDEFLYYNRKGTFSMNAMIICDYNMKVRLINACHSGSCDDSLIWSVSGARNYFLNEYQNGDTCSRLLGDSSYGLEPFLMTPYKNVTLGTMEHKYNQKHSSAHKRVERVICILKSRFRCLLVTLDYSPQEVVKIINVCCALHNICREYNIEMNEDPILNINEELDEIDCNDIVNICPRRLFKKATVTRDSIASQIK